MIAPARIKELLERRPFRPFRLLMSDGSSHAVSHPEFAWAFGGRVFVGVAGRAGSADEGEVKELALLHVTRIEEGLGRRSGRQGQR